ncbi:MAG TPA: hypothetical protein VIN35_03145, partial [Hydrogenophaga sp.]
TPTRFTRRLALGALAGAALLASVPALAEGRLVDVRIVDRDSGRTLPVYAFKGDLWVAGKPGARYAVQLTNQSRGRLLNVVSVDGVNVVSGETAAFDQTGYVLDPYQRYDVAGWRKSSRQIAAFEFSRAPKSYAARTGRPDDVGVIGVAVFREKQPDWDERDQQRSPGRSPYGQSGPVPRSGSMPKSGPSGKSFQFDNNGPVEQEPGTAHGDRERDRVGKTEFERDSHRPDEIIRIRYDSYANLVEMGVIPAYRGRPREPSAFPAQRPRWVPDPW